MPGKLIFVEGIDGCGKSTLARGLTQQFSPVTRWRFPSDGPIGKLIRASFADENMLDRATYLYLMIADGIDQERNLLNAVKAGINVIVDRHTLVSGYVYQQEDHHLDDIHAVQSSHEWIRPDAVLIVDVPAEVAMARMKGRDKYEDRVFEKDSAAYYERLRQRYLRFAQESTWPCHVLDGTGEPDVVLKAAWTLLMG